ncbi:CLUMA_CG011112, isoform A [Clunio marinus]|uniref:CLUMA_CG011112, isoform A n=1 Tax=Clunio marinus TaxID=568069 RepID=A0A1J1IDU9_9DIPT|nr:CLUMA_CG011112, isoform A [Clunio marinus]
MRRKKRASKTKLIFHHNLHLCEYLHKNDEVWKSDYKEPSIYLPMSDVEKTKRSEKSLQPYRFLLNEISHEKLAIINQVIMSLVNRKAMSVIIRAAE